MGYKYKVLKPFLLPAGTYVDEEEDIDLDPVTFQVSPFFIEKLVEHGFVEEIKELPSSFGIIATSKLAGVEIADRDYVEGDKKYFTFDEALEVENKLKNTGWRLPTRHEWALICEEFGNDNNDRLYSYILMEKLGLELSGYELNGYSYSLGNYGYYWSSTENSNANQAYYLHFNDSGVNPSGNYSRYLGFPVRLVREIKESNNG